MPDGTREGTAPPEEGEAELNDKQKLRNALSSIEDHARTLRNQRRQGTHLEEAFNLIVQLTQIVREDIVQ